MWLWTSLCAIYMGQIVFSSSGSSAPLPSHSVTSASSPLPLPPWLSLPLLSPRLFYLLLSCCCLSFSPLLFTPSLPLSSPPSLSSSCQAGWCNPRLCQGLRSNRNCGGQIYFLQDTGSVRPGIPCRCAVWSDTGSRIQDCVLSYMQRGTDRETQIY